MTRIPRRILIIENAIGFGGSVVCARFLASHLDPALFLPKILTTQTGPEFEKIAADTSWQYVSNQHWDPSKAKNHVANSKWIRKIPGATFILNQIVARADDVINFLPYLIRLFWIAKRYKTSLIHINNEPLCNRAGILVAKLLRVPVISHVRADPIFRGGLVRWYYQQPDHFISVSNWVNDAIGKLGVPENKRNVIYDGIALEAMDVNEDGAAFRDSYAIPEEAFAVGLVGMLVEWKGQHLFLDAAKRLRQHIPNLRMLLIGGNQEGSTDAYEQELRERVVTEGLGDLVLFTGMVANMPPVYNGLDVVVSASVSPEPLGTMVIESMTMARPLVAPNFGGAAEMTEHEVSSLLFVPGDAASLAESILRLYRDPELGTRLGKHARQKALETFSIERHAKAVEAIYLRYLQ